MIIRYFLIFTFLCGMFSTKAPAQPHLEQGDLLFERGRFFEASIQYERVIFDQPGWDLLHKSRYKKALCYRHLGRYEDALSEIRRIALFHAEDSFKTKVLYEKAFNLLLSNYYSEALLTIKQIKEGEISESIISNILPLKILILNRNRKWNQAKSVFYRWLKTLSYSEKMLRQWKDTISVFYSESRLPANYSGKTARNWSRFIPGAGQTYAGHPWEGAGSFLLNGAAMGLGIQQIWNGFYFTGYVAGFGIFYKTYFGGMERAANLADIENENEMVSFNKSCSRIIQKLIQNQSSSSN